MTAALIVFSVLGWSGFIYSYISKKKQVAYWKGFYVAADRSLKEAVKKNNKMLEDMRRVANHLDDGLKKEIEVYNKPLVGNVVEKTAEQSLRRPFVKKRRF